MQALIIKSVIRIPQDLYDRVIALAKRERRSINSQLIVLIERALATE